ncbi:MAG: DUF1588 domain-containing protein [Myxococcota bacterium]
MVNPVFRALPRWRLAIVVLALSACVGEVGEPNLPAPEAVAEPRNERPAPRVGFRCDDAAPPAPPERVWRLTEEHYRQTVLRAAALLGLSNPLEDIRVPQEIARGGDRFSTLARSQTIDEASFRDSLQAARSLGIRFASAAACDTDCAALISVGERLFRRPLTPEEQSRFEGLFRDRGAEDAFTALFLSPAFLFRVETGDDGRLPPLAIATALAFALTDAPPGDVLLAAAESGSLGDREGVKTEIRRILAEPAREPVIRFFRQYFRYDEASAIDKDQRLRFHDPRALEADTDRLVAHLVSDFATTELLREMLLHPGSAPDEDTAESYGLDSNEVDGAYREDPARFGVLSQPAWLVAHSQPEGNDPIRRGKFIRGSMLCQTIPPVPIQEIPMIEYSEDRTLRELLAEHTEDASCRACHDLMDPLGLTFEAFDHLGRPRTMEAGRPVDTSGEIRSVSDALDGSVASAEELLRRIATSEIVEECFVSHAFEYWLGRAALEDDECALAEAQTAYRESGGSYVELLATLLSSDSALIRTEGTDR